MASCNRIQEPSIQTPLSFFHKAAPTATTVIVAGGGCWSVYAARVWGRDRKRAGVVRERETPIHKSNKVMPFRVIKFCKHSPGGSTVISEPFLMLPAFLTAFPALSTSHSLTYWHSLFCSSSIPTSVLTLLPFVVFISSVSPFHFLLLFSLICSQHPPPRLSSCS